jgi:hypothetical protein
MPHNLASIKETVARDFRLLVFHRSNPPGPLIHVQKYFRNRFRIRRDMRIRSLNAANLDAPLFHIAVSH